VQIIVDQVLQRATHHKEVYDGLRTR
jgi:hypothetical protein